MAFRLKDKELQKKLEEIGGEQNVKKSISEYEENDFGGAVFAFSINDKFRITVGTTKDEIEEVPEYNPHGWNNYPAVKPPENVWMRVELNNPDGSVFRDVARFVEDGGQYYWVDQFKSDRADVQVARFRPWEE